MRLGNAVWGLFLSTFCFISLRADVTGSIFGTVRDKTQAVVTGARVVATNVETNLTKETISGNDGEYRLLALPPGTYTVEASAAGFNDFITKNIACQSERPFKDRYCV